MIVNDRITDYIQSLETSQGPVLDEIEKEALDQFVPIIRKETAAFLRTMTAALKPSAILEIGTAVGYSALQMCRVMPEHCRITTIEKYEKRLPIARENFHRAGESGRITLLEGDADVHLKELAKKGCQFDLVFMDAICKLFADSIKTGKRNSRLPFIRDSAIASENAWLFLKDAHQHVLPAIGELQTLEEIRERRKHLKNGYGLLQSHRYNLIK